MIEFLGNTLQGIKDPQNTQDVSVRKDLLKQIDQLFEEFENLKTDIDVQYMIKKEKIEKLSKDTEMEAKILSDLITRNNQKLASDYQEPAVVKQLEKSITSLEEAKESFITQYQLYLDQSNVLEKRYNDVIKPLDIEIVSKELIQLMYSFIQKLYDFEI